MYRSDHGCSPLIIFRNELDEKRTRIEILFFLGFDVHCEKQLGNILSFITSLLFVWVCYSRAHGTSEIKNKRGVNGRNCREWIYFTFVVSISGVTWIYAPFQPSYREAVPEGSECCVERAVCGWKDESPIQVIARQKLRLHRCIPNLKVEIQAEWFFKVQLSLRQFLLQSLRKADAQFHRWVAYAYTANSTAFGEWAVQGTAGQWATGSRSSISAILVSKMSPIVVAGCHLTVISADESKPHPTIRILAGGIAVHWSIM